MRRLFGTWFFLMALALGAQDKIYLQNGERIDAKVTDIGPETIRYLLDTSHHDIDIGNVVLIQFSNGKTEIIHFPYFDRSFSPVQPLSGSRRPESKKASFANEFYINTLALVNSEIAANYEYFPPAKKVGFGLLGTYNFNSYATLPNLFIAILDNAKKHYDAGGFLNVYTGKASAKTRLFYGITLKYTAFSFTAVNEDSVYNAGVASAVINYTPAKGSQFSTLFTMGFHQDLNETVFLKSTFSIGWFRLRGVYREQYNKILNDGLEPGETPFNLTYLPKANIGLMVGIKF